MAEGAGEAADDLELETLPEADGTLVRGHDEVELHGAIAAGGGVAERVGAHGAGDAAAGGRRGRHVAAVGDVGAAAGLVGAEEVGPENAARGVGDEDFVGGGLPVGEGIVAGTGGGEGVGLAAADDRFEDRPEGVGVGGSGGADGEGFHCGRSGLSVAEFVLTYIRCGYRVGAWR